eukprot:UN0809
MGTRTVSRTLYELGIERSYHGEELLMHVWSAHATDFFRKPENGGLRNVPVSLPWAPTNRSDMVLQATNQSTLAGLISSCKAEAVAFDGIEKLFFPVYAISPGAKVLVLNWRTFDEARVSMNNFFGLFLPYLIFLGHLFGSVQVLPWGLFVPYVTEPLFGNVAREYLQTGLPPVNQVQSPYSFIFMRFMSSMRIVSHWFDGLCLWDGMTQERHTAFFEQIQKIVPPQDRMDFDVRKNTYEDLCKFLGMKECRRSGKLPRAINLGNHELDFLPAFVLCLPILLGLHWINFRIFTWSLQTARGAAVACCRRRRQHSKAE